MAFIIGKVCPGIKNRTGALISALSALFLASCLIVSDILSMVYTYRDFTDGDQNTPAQREMTQCYYGAGFVIWGVWAMFTIVMLFGVIVENKRALGFWLAYTAIIPVYFVGGLIFLLAATKIKGWAISYLVVQACNLAALIWICLAVWVYFCEIRQRDKNPELRVDEFVRRKENEMMFTQPFMGVMPPAGSYNPGYGAPSGGSMSSIPRSQKSRQTYAPTEAGESVKYGSTVPRQSRLDQYRAQHVEKEPVKTDRSRSRSGERDGGTTYYRYQYTADQKANGSYHGSQGSLSGRPVQPPQYQPARYQRPAQPPQAQVHASQGSLGGRQAYQPQAQHHASQGSLGGRQGYAPRHHASQGSLGGRPQYNLQAQDNQYSKDSEV